MRTGESELPSPRTVEAGPRATVTPAGSERPRAAKVAGSTVGLFVDATVPGADLYGGVNVLAPGGRIPLHWHPVGELQFILSGTGLFVDADGSELPVGSHGSVFSPAGPSGAHGFVNNGPVPLAILFVYASPGGIAPDLTFLGEASGP